MRERTRERERERERERREGELRVASRCTDMYMTFFVY